jgi:hypothetical protein
MSFCRGGPLWPPLHGINTGVATGRATPTIHRLADIISQK